MDNPRKQPRAYKHTPEAMAELKALDRMAAEILGWRNITDLGFDTVGDPPYDEARRHRPIPRPSQQLDAMLKFARHVVQHENVEYVAFLINKRSEDECQLFATNGSMDRRAATSLPLAFCRLVRDTHIDVGQPDSTPYADEVLDE